MIREDLGKEKELCRLIKIKVCTINSKRIE